MPFLGCIPLSSKCKGGWRFWQTCSDARMRQLLANELKKITQNVVSEVIKRNKDLPDSEAIKITTMAGCSAVN